MTTLNRLATALVALATLWLVPVTSAHAQVQVTAASPASAPQGSISLEVEISGNGFDATATVQFLVTGTTNPGGITVRKVVVRGSKKLVATIDIADTAVIDKFDVQVALSDGRKGKGTTLFAVLPKTTGDACATPGLEFPAFIYWKDGGNQTRDYYVADSTGVCSRRVITGQRGGQLARFSYPVAGNLNLGRIVYLDYDGTTHSISAVDFDVQGTNIDIRPKYNVTVAGPSTMDLSPDGQILYYSVTASSNDATVLTGHLYKLAIPTEVGTAGTEIYAETGSVIQTLSVTADGSAIYASQNYPFGSPPLYAGYRIVRINVATAASVVVTQGATGDTYFLAANDSTASTRFAFSQSLSASGIQCSQVNVGNWETAGATLTALPAYARRLTWYGGNILVDGYKPPDRRGQCASTGMITRVSPTGAVVPLVRGLDPDGR